MPQAAGCKHDHHPFSMAQEAQQNVAKPKTEAEKGAVL